MKRFVLHKLHPVLLPRLNTNRRRWLDRSLKLLLVAVLGYVLYQQRIKGQDLGQLYAHARQELGPASLIWTLCALGLMPFNWWLESRKWQCFTARFTKLSAREHLRAVLVGVTFSLFTPNRLGDYLGRVLASKNTSRQTVILATVAANMVQLVVLLGFGWMGALYFFPIWLQIDWGQWWPLATLGVVATITLAMILLHLPNLLFIVKRWPQIQRIGFVRHSVDVAKTYTRRPVLRALVLATARYGVYSLQYYCMLRVVGIDLDMGTALAGIASVFLIQTSVPLPPALGLIARGEIALFMWGHFADNELSILTATYGLFLINLLLPGLYGLATVVQMNLIKPNGHDDSTVTNRRPGTDHDHADGPIPTGGTHN